MKNANIVIGGYNHTSTAKLWSILTHKIISGSIEIPPLPQNVPEHEFWPLYAHDEDLSVTVNQEYNDQEIAKIETIRSYADKRIYF